MLCRSMLIRSVFISALVTIAISAAIGAQPPRFNYQGKLTDGGGVPLQGNQAMTFWIYEGGSAGSANSGTLKYKETVTLNAAAGVINHTVGTGTPVGSALSNGVFRSSADLFLQVAVGAESNVILPRQRLESVPFSINSADGDARTPLSGPLPITISTPGSYYLTQSLTNAALTGGITIAVPGVTLDLNGFTLTGAGTSGSNYGILIEAPSGPMHDIAIYNGNLRNFTTGIAAFNFVNTATISNVTASDNGQGFDMDGTRFRFDRCTAAGNNGTGFSLDERSIVTNCFSTNNGGTGFAVISFSIVENCLSEGDAQLGFNASTGSTFRNCTVFFSGSHGFSGGGGTIVENCVTFNSVGDAIRVGSGSIVRDSVGDSDGGMAIRGTTNSTISNCTVIDATTTGIQVSAGSIIDSCVVTGSTGVGIDLIRDATARQCRVSANDTHEIFAGSRCTIVDNDCDGMAGEIAGPGNGIHVTGTSCMVERNVVTFNQIGISAITGNLFVSNRARGNTSAYSLGGSAAGATVTSGNVSTYTNPAANLSY